MGKANSEELMNRAKDASENVDWDCIDREKAEFLYKEARIVQNDITSNMNTLQEKSFQFLTINITILSVIASYLITQFNELDVLLRFTGIAFGTLLSISAISFVYAVWPRQFRFTAVEPGGYFLDEYYKESLDGILHGNILVANDDIDMNFQVLEKRAVGLKLGVIFLISAPIVTLLIFLITKVVQLINTPLVMSL